MATPNSTVIKKNINGNILIIAEGGEYTLRPDTLFTEELDGVRATDVNSTFREKFFVSDVEKVVRADGKEILITDVDTLYVELSEKFKSAKDVSLQDQTTQPIIAKFNRVTNSTTLAVNALKGDTSITLTSGTGLVAPAGDLPGSYIILFNPTTALFMFAHATNIAGSPVVVLDTPLANDFDSTTFVDIALTNLNEIGTLASPIIFGLRGVGAPPGVDVTVDITRIMYKCIVTDPANLSKFGDLSKLTNGLVLRRRNGTTENIFNVKDNGEIKGIMFDFDVVATINPQQGVNGFNSRMTFAGSNKIGVALRLPIGDDLEHLIQDDLFTAQTGSQIKLFEIVAEGHLVQE